MIDIILGKDPLLKDLARLGDVIERDGWKVAKAVSDSYVFEVHLVDAIDTGKLLRSIDWRAAGTKNGAFQYLVDSSKDPDVTYDGFVEQGTIYMPARFPAKRGIEKTDFKVHFDRFISDALSESQ